jgi:hypothetical protein
MLLNAQQAPSSPHELTWQGALGARLNVLYYQRVIGRAQRLDTWIRIASFLLSSAGVVVAVKWINVDAITIAVGLLAAILSTLTLVLGLPERARTAAAFVPQYLAHYNRFVALYLQGDTVDPQNVVSALDAMGATAVAEVEKLPVEDRKLIAEADAQLRREIGAVPTVLDCGK